MTGDGIKPDRKPQNSRAIVINSLSRGGSNILWNILQSHPQICSPIRETGELIFDEITPFRFFPPATAKRMAACPVVRLFGKRHLRRAFQGWKMHNFQSPDNGEKSEGVPYRKEEIANAIICFKGVDSDVELNDLLDALYGDVMHIALVRNGYAVCDGWMRRGLSAENAGRKYAGIVRRMLATRESADTFVLVKFEETMRDPFGTAERLFRGLGLEPSTLPKLRLKAKRVLDASGGHETRFGEEGKKYWFGPDEIAEVLDPDIDHRQRSRLDPKSREAFECKARAALEELGYLENASP